MRLSTIKLAGFKSFVDPTTIDFPGQRVAIVGPNGCGKSNIIDAIRWVMGESRAKYLRGESMADVIFNGSAARKPVAMASIELIFDNSDGFLQGEYARYNQISVKRVATRDGQSSYYLNGTRCRRRDVTDLFLGTGLGPRSYAVIEQGTISRIIEARPEELRVYLEEISGIAKYKERRRETEQRMDVTRENLQRVHDIQQELEKQLQHLAKQAKAAEKFKVLKTEERYNKALLLALQWQNFEKQEQQKFAELNNLEQRGSKLKEECEQELALFNVQKYAFKEQNELWQMQQTEIHQLDLNVQKKKQESHYQQEKIQQQEQEFSRLKQFLLQLERQHQDDKQKLTSKVEQQEQLAPEVDRQHRAYQLAQEQLTQLELQLQQTQQQWEREQQTYAQKLSQAEVSKTQIHHLELRVQENQERIEKLEIEKNNINKEWDDKKIKLLEEQLESIQKDFDEASHLKQKRETELRQHTEKQEGLRKEIQTKQDQLIQKKGKLTSIETLQHGVLAEKNNLVTKWLQQHELADKPRLGRLLEVETGWELAVEIALQEFLPMISLEQCMVPSHAEELKNLKSSHVGFLYPTDYTKKVSIINEKPLMRLIDKMITSIDLQALLGHIFIAIDLTEAQQHLASLAEHESIVTQDGYWLGHGWLKYGIHDQNQSGIISREREIKQLSEEIQQLNNEINQAQLHFNAEQLRLQEEKASLEINQKQLAEMQQNLLQCKNKLDWERKEYNRVQTKLVALQNEDEKLLEQMKKQQEDLVLYRKQWQEAVDILEKETESRNRLSNLKNELSVKLQNQKQEVKTFQEKHHAQNMALQNLIQDISHLSQSLQRIEQQTTQNEQRVKTLNETIVQAKTQINLLIDDFERENLALKEKQENFLSTKETVDQIKKRMEHLEQNLTEKEKQLEINKQKCDELKLLHQGLQIRRNTTEEQFSETDFILTEFVANLTESKNLTEVEQTLQEVQQRIQRLGAVNLAAIQEFEEIQQRKTHLDEQVLDLQNALATLEGAIKRIDKETKDRFQETYELVNRNFSELFPAVFGGGEASLKMSNDDVLEAGIYVIARPPGKKNSTIHLLSGGEKALTALALVFAFFQLNPAPFCLLDEVDAPLDDNNVGRFCSLVKKMSNAVQFIFISHNKIAIEMAEQLIGVTMREPGVSRMVSVDIQQALDMVE